MPAHASSSYATSVLRHLRPTPPPPKTIFTSKRDLLNVYTRGHFVVPNSDSNFSSKRTGQDNSIETVPNTTHDAPPDTPWVLAFLNSRTQNSATRERPSTNRQAPSASERAWAKCIERDELIAEKGGSSLWRACNRLLLRLSRVEVGAVIGEEGAGG